MQCKVQVGLNPTAAGGEHGTSSKPVLTDRFGLSDRNGFSIVPVLFSVAVFFFFENFPLC
jgi:hypothetical protein